MSEYWVSKKKYFCKYCNIYIADDVPSRRQHESGLRHKGNVERFVRGLYKTGEKRKQDLEEEKREMARVEQAAQAAFARDVGAGLVKPGSSSTAPVASSSSAPSAKERKPTNPYADYSTAESLGFTDPDAERLKAEAERRRMEGVAGEWEVVAVEERESSAAQEESKADITTSQPLADGTGRKREAEEIFDPEDGRQWKLRKKTTGVGLGEIYDPGVIQIKPRQKKEEPSETTLSPEAGPASSAGPSGSAATSMPKWSARGWNKPGADHANADNPTSENGPQMSSEDGPDVKQETEKDPSVATQSNDIVQKTEGVKLEEEAARSQELVNGTGGSLFRKRKAPASGAGSRGSRF